MPPKSSFGPGLERQNIQNEISSEEKPPSKHWSNSNTNSVRQSRDINRIGENLNARSARRASASEGSSNLLNHSPVTIRAMFNAREAKYTRASNAKRTDEKKADNACRSARKPEIATDVISDVTLKRGKVEGTKPAVNSEVLKTPDDPSTKEPRNTTQNRRRTIAMGDIKHTNQVRMNRGQLLNRKSDDVKPKEVHITELHTWCRQCEATRPNCLHCRLTREQNMPQPRPSNKQLEELKKSKPDAYDHVVKQLEAQEGPEPKFKGFKRQLKKKADVSTKEKTTVPPEITYPQASPLPPGGSKVASHSRSDSTASAPQSTPLSDPIAAIVSPTAAVVTEPEPQKEKVRERNVSRKAAASSNSTSSIKRGKQVEKGKIGTTVSTSTNEAKAPMEVNKKVETGTKTNAQKATSSCEINQGTLVITDNDTNTKKKIVPKASAWDPVFCTQEYKDLYVGDWHLPPKKWKQEHDVRYKSWNTNDSDSRTLWESNNSQESPSPTHTNVSATQSSMPYFEHPKIQSIPDLPSRQPPVGREPENCSKHLAKDGIESSNTEPPLSPQNHRSSSVKASSSHNTATTQSSRRDFRTLCFNCWNHGHAGNSCRGKRIEPVSAQEKLRCEKGMPLTLAWHRILQANDIVPIESRTEEEIELLTKERQDDPSEFISKNPTEIGAFLQQPGGEQSTSADPKPLENKNDKTKQEPFTDEEAIPVDLFFVEDPNEADWRIAKDHRRLSTPLVGKARRVPRPRKSTLTREASIRSDGLPKDSSPIARLPNEVLSMIFRILLEADLPYLFLPSQQRSIFSDEKAVSLNNLRLNAVRQTCGLWRNICQRELYGNVSITSLDGMALFTRSIDQNPALASFVRCLRFELSSGSVAQRGSLLRVQHEVWADEAGTYLSTILDRCRDIKCLIAHIDGGLRGLNNVRSDYPHLVKLSIKDGLVRRKEIKHIWKIVQRFPDLNFLEIEYEHEPQLVLAPEDCIWDRNRNRNLETLVLKRVPTINNQWLEELHNFPKLKSLTISECRGITSRGLSYALSNFRDGQLTTLSFTVWSEWTGTAETQPTLLHCDHMCEIIPRKFGDSLTHLYLSPLYICEMIVGETNWSKLESLRIQAVHFRGCTERVKKETLLQAVQSRENRRLQEAIDIDFGVPHITVVPNWDK